jgi:hypothetical protein
MPDYVTRAELDSIIADLVDRLTVRGDDQTMQVDSGPGGQVVRSIQVIGDDPAVKSYITVSYDSGATEFTITFTDLPMTLLNHRYSATYEEPMSIWEVDSTFVFDVPASGSQTINFYATQLFVPGAERNLPKIRWDSSDAVASDAATRALQFDIVAGTGNNPIAVINIVDDGTASITSQPDETMIPVPTGTTQFKPRLYIETSTKQIELRNSLTLFGDTVDNYDYTGDSLPLDTQMFIVYDLDSSINPALATSGAGFDVSIPLGRVLVNSSNEVIRIQDIFTNSYVQSPGKTENVAISGTTLQFRNGIYINNT